MAVIINFAGEYDVANADAIRSELEAVVDDREVVLDLTRVAYIDSSILAELIRARDRRIAKGTPPMTVVVKTAGSVGRLFKLTRLDELFGVVPELDDDIRYDPRFQVRTPLTAKG